MSGSKSFLVGADHLSFSVIIVDYKIFRCLKNRFLFQSRSLALDMLKSRIHWKENKCGTKCKRIPGNKTHPKPFSGSV